MARRRMIDPNFWESLDVWNLTIRQRLLAIGLFSLADDEGRGIADTRWIKAKIFPADNFGPTEIEEDLQAIEKHLSFTTYEVDGKKYYAWLNWRKWQTVEKPRKSDIPAPETIRGNVGEESGNGRGNVGEESGRSRLLNRSRSRREVEEEGNIVVVVDRSVSDHKKDPAANDCQLAATGDGDLFSLFEKEFARPLSPLEIEQLKSWLDKHDAGLVKEALRRAVLRGKMSFRYIDSILLTWEKLGIRTVREAMERDPPAAAEKQKQQGGDLNGRTPANQPATNNEMPEWERRFFGLDEPEPEGSA